MKVPYQVAYLTADKVERYYECNAADAATPEEIIERHFPWYLDDADTDNLDCQCGHQISGGIAEWSSHVAADVVANATAPTKAPGPITNRQPPWARPS